MATVLSAPLRFPILAATLSRMVDAPNALSATISTGTEPAS